MKAMYCMWPLMRAVKETAAAGFKVSKKLTDKLSRRTAQLEVKPFTRNLLRREWKSELAFEVPK